MDEKQIERNNAEWTSKSIGGEGKVAMLLGSSGAPTFSIFFFFQAEDGIRDFHVTEVQTCALPIYTRDTSLQAITDMNVGHPWLGRIVGYGEIDLLTAAEAGTSKIRFLPDADGFKRALLDAKQEHELEVGGGKAVQEAVAAVSAQPAEDRAQPAGMSAEELDSALSRLADMRDRGLITQAEFDDKKRELLERM